MRLLHDCSAPSRAGFRVTLPPGVQASRRPGASLTRPSSAMACGSVLIWCMAGQKLLVLPAVTLSRTNMPCRLAQHVAATLLQGSIRSRPPATLLPSALEPAAVAAPSHSIRLCYPLHFLKLEQATLILTPGIFRNCVWLTEETFQRDNHVQTRRCAPCIKAVIQGEKTINGYA